MARQLGNEETRVMKQIATFAFVMLMATAAMHVTTGIAASAGARVTAGAVKVTVNYTGKGTVDATHRVWVWLFTTPDIGPGSMPIAEASIDANGSLATFDGIDAERVWIAAAFDESGTMRGSAPPPSGSPVGFFAGTDSAPKSVVPGEPAVVMTFDDSFRMP
jgi:hypothetical protein